MGDFSPDSLYHRLSFRLTVNPSKSVGIQHLGTVDRESPKLVGKGCLRAESLNFENLLCVSNGITLNKEHRKPVGGSRSYNVVAHVHLKSQIIPKVAIGHSGRVVSVPD